MKDIFKQEVHHANHLWRNSFVFSLFLMFFTGLYIYFEQGEYTMRMFNKTTAWVSIILIGLSLLLSSLCYFFDIFDKKIIYRKQLGVWGFAYAAFHSVFTIYLLSKRFNVIEYLSEPENTRAFIAAVISLAFLTFLALISHNGAVKFFGGGTWRKLMRLGYVALFFGIIHFMFKRYEDVFTWVESGSFIPPIAGVLLTFSIFVIAARVLLELHVRLSKRKKTE